MHNNALRFVRWAMAAWTLFAVTLGVSQYGSTYFGVDQNMCSILGTCAQGAFALGCLCVAGTAGLLTFSSAARY